MHLEQALDEKISSFGGNIDQFRERITILYEGINDLRAILVAHIESINAHIKSYFKEIQEVKQ
jgi:hypothetical protein